MGYIISIGRTFRALIYVPSRTMNAGLQGNLRATSMAYVTMHFGLKLYYATGGLSDEDRFYLDRLLAPPETVNRVAPIFTRYKARPRIVARKFSIPLYFAVHGTKWRNQPRQHLPFRSLSAPEIATLQRRSTRSTVPDNSSGAHFIGTAIHILLFLSHRYRRSFP